MTLNEHLILFGVWRMVRSYETPHV